MHVIVFLLEIDHFLRWDMVNPWIKLTVHVVVISSVFNVFE